MKVLQGDDLAVLPELFWIFPESGWKFPHCLVRQCYQSTCLFWNFSKRFI